MKRISYIIVILVVFIGCAHPKPRKPVAHTGSMDMSQSIAYNKLLNQQEEGLIKAFMEKDSLHNYIDSQHGFWYAYDIKKELDTTVPVKGDEVQFLYSVKDLKGNEIYSQYELGEKTYLIDQQDFMQGIQEGIKLMKVDEKIVFLLPSIKAYGVYGDQKKIKENTPLVVTVELLNIQK